MRQPRLAGIDTNLVVALHALLLEKNVARASQRIGLSPSATSHALARLRDALGDEVLVQAGRGMVLTPRARDLLPVVQEVARGLELVFAPPAEVVPAQITRAFMLGATDHVELLMLERVLARFASEAPQLKLGVRPAGPGTLEELRAGALDFSIWAAPDVPRDCRSAELFRDPFITIVRRDHPLTRGPLTVEAFAACSHLLVSPSGLRRAPVDKALAERGLERRVALTVSHFMPVPFLVAESDLVATLSAHFARRMLAIVPIVALEPPLLLPVPTVQLIWHGSMDADPAHRWVRDALIEATRFLSSTQP